MRRAKPDDAAPGLIMDQVKRAQQAGKISRHETVGNVRSRPIQPAFPRPAQLATCTAPMVTSPVAVEFTTELPKVAVKNAETIVSPAPSARFQL